MHQEDTEFVVYFCISQSQAGVDHEADYRALTKDNGYVWIRDVVHVVRNDKGETESLVGFMFDISERKKTEDHLLSLPKELAALSFKDGLTGVANSRRFDACLELECTSARRSGQPLSVILLDIDFFKQFNDLYGHIAGDQCLTSVAQTLALAIARPRDIAARFGGEEFVILLPETDEVGAQEVAERCQRLVEKLRIPHEKSDDNPYVSFSMGVGTIIPSPDMEPTAFINAVDKLLYTAKQNGRNRIETAQLA